jgi:hypothetical protein
MPNTTVDARANIINAAGSEDPIGALLSQEANSFRLRMRELLNANRRQRLGNRFNPGGFNPPPRPTPRNQIDPRAPGGVDGNSPSAGNPQGNRGGVGGTEGGGRGTAGAGGTSGFLPNINGLDGSGGFGFDGGQFKRGLSKAAKYGLNPTGAAVQAGIRYAWNKWKNRDKSKEPDDFVPDIPRDGTGRMIATMFDPAEPESTRSERGQALWDNYYAAAPWRNRRSKGKRSKK